MCSKCYQQSKRGGWFNFTLSLSLSSSSSVRKVFEDYEQGMEKSVHVRIIASWIHIREGIVEIREGTLKEVQL